MKTKLPFFEFIFFITICLSLFSCYDNKQLVGTWKNSSKQKSELCLIPDNPESHFADCVYSKTVTYFFYEDGSFKKSVFQNVISFDLNYSDSFEKDYKEAADLLNTTDVKNKLMLDVGYEIKGTYSVRKNRLLNFVNEKLITTSDGENKEISYSEIPEESGFENPINSFGFYIEEGSLFIFDSQLQQYVKYRKLN